MPIASGDIQYRYSGGATNTNPHLSLGGVISGTAWPGSGTEDLFDNVTGTENAAADVEYRCVYIRNNHGTLTLTDTRVWFTETAGGANVAIGLDPAGIGNGSTTGVAGTAANENTAPAPAVTFSTAPVSYATGLAVGGLGPAQAIAVWIRRTATNSAALTTDSFTLHVQGDTLA